MSETVQPQRSGRLNDNADMFLQVAKDPLLRMTISAVLVLDGVPNRDAVLAHLERMSRSVPGCRHRLLAPPLRLATPRWVVDPDFDLSYHLRWIAAPEPRTLDTVFEYARQSAMSGLDPDRPLWTCTVVEGLDGGRAAVIFKLSHVLADGMGGIAMLPFLADVTREPGDPGQMPGLPGDHVTASWPGLVLDALGANHERVSSFVRVTGWSALRHAPRVIVNPVGALGTAARNLQALRRIGMPGTDRLSPIMAERRGWARFAAIDVDLAALRAAGRSRNATVNDAFVTAVSYGFARYHEKHAAPVGQLRAVVAVSTRREGDSPYGNYLRGGALTLPVGTDDPAQYMEACHDAVVLLREDARQPVVTALDVVARALGPFVSGFMGSVMKHCDFAASNVPGIQVPLYFGGAEMLAMYGFGPLFGTAADITLLSYHGTAFIGFNVDSAAVPDVEMLVDCMREGFDAVLALAG